MTKPAKVALPSLRSQLAQAQADLIAARDAAEAIANEENASLNSDDLFASWLRKKRIAENEHNRLIGLVVKLEKRVEKEEERQPSRSSTIAISPLLNKIRPWKS